MIYKETKNKIRNAVEAMSKKRGYFKATSICNQLGLDQTLTRLMRESGLLETTFKRGSRYVGPKTISEQQYLAIYAKYAAYIRAKGKKRQIQLKAKMNAAQNRKPAAPKQVEVRPQKNRVRLLWGLIDFTY